MPIELSVESDSRPFDKKGGFGRSERGGRGTANLNASKLVGTDLDAHIGPVPGAGTECMSSSCSDTNDTYDSAEGDACPVE